MGKWKSHKTYPDIWYLHTALDYDPATGHFWWRHRPDMPKCWNNKHAGKRAGTVRTSTHYTANGVKCPDRKYVAIALGGHAYQAGWFALALSYGHYPEHELDYVSGDGTDNRLRNLREATTGQNRSKRGRIQGRTLPIGVHLRPSGRFAAMIKVAGEIKHLGVFDTPGPASKAYAAAARKQNGVFASKEVL